MNLSVCFGKLKKIFRKLFFICVFCVTAGSALNVFADVGLEHLNDAEKNLRSVELDIAQNSEALRLLSQQIKAEKAEFASLEQRKLDYTQVIAMQHQSLASTLKLSYALERANPVKIVLNQQNSEQIDRYLQYEKILNQDRLQAIQKIQSLLTELQQTEIAIQNKSEQLQTQKQQLASKQKALQKLYSARKMEVKILNDKIQASRETDAQLHNQHILEQALQTVPAHLQSSQQNQTSNTLEQESELAQENHQVFQRNAKQFSQGENSNVDQANSDFNQLKGRLPYPVLGKLHSKYGQTLDSSDLTSQAIEISAPIGAPVRAVASGQIVFADWLKGVGLLIIIDHGHGFLTLYGHLQSLAKHMGDTVYPGEEIAFVGNSGGIDKSALYFQIRGDGKPLNPMLWLKS